MAWRVTAAKASAISFYDTLTMTLLQVQFLDDIDKVGLLIFHAENLDGVLELDNGKTFVAAVLITC